ncbi:MAG TPA: OmpA family protein [Acetobacteraceae bacterium]|nr:OmpA family protein [Acetobacteraceae bacterium]
MRVLITSIIVAPLVLGSLPAFAQSNPSASQIINSLKPSGNLVMGGTRGIRLAAPTDGAQPSPPQAAAKPAATPQTHVASSKPMAPAAASSASGPAVSLTVNFANGSADLTPDAIKSLDTLGQALSSKDLAGYKFRIEGHTDTVGSPTYNKELSERRAEAVVDYIAKKFSVEPTRLQAVGMGEEGLLVQTPAQTPEPRNRRVQVINLGA